MERMGLAGAIAGVVLGGLVATAGCGDGGEGAGGGDAAELHGGFPAHHRHRGSDADSAAGTTGGGPGVATGGTTGGGAAPGTTGTNGATGAADGGAVADCEICTQARQCCEAVQADTAGCMFSAAACSAEAGEARPAYANGCLTYVVTVRGAWSGHPPAACL